MVSAVTLPGFPLSLRVDGIYTNLKSSTVDSMVSAVTLPGFPLSLRGRLSLEATSTNCLFTSIKASWKRIVNLMLVYFLKVETIF